MADATQLTVTFRAQGAEQVVAATQAVLANLRQVATVSAALGSQAQASGSAQGSAWQQVTSRVQAAAQALLGTTSATQAATAVQQQQTTAVEAATRATVQASAATQLYRDALTTAATAQGGTAASANAVATAKQAVRAASQTAAAALQQYGAASQQAQQANAALRQATDGLVSAQQRHKETVDAARSATVSLGGAIGGLGGPLGSAGAAFASVNLRVSEMQSRALLAASAVTALGTAALHGLGSLGSQAADFEQAMSQVKAVLSPAELATSGAALTDLALKLGKAGLGFSATEAAGGLEAMAKAGISVNDIAAAAPSVLQLAAAGSMRVADAADFAANNLAVFSLKGADMAHVADLMAGAANATSADVSDLRLSMQQFGAVASLTNQTIDSATTAIALMAQAGIKGSDAGTSLKTMFLNLQPSTEKATETMKALGLITADGANQFLNANGTFKQAGEIAGLLAEATKNLTAAQRAQALETVFGTDAIRAATVMAKTGAEGWNALTTEIGKTTVADTARTRLDNLAGSMTNLRNAANVAAIELGTNMAPGLRGLVDGATNIVTAFTSLPPAVQATLGQTALLTAGIATLGAGLATLGIVGPAAAAGLAALGISVGALALPVAGVIAASAGLALAWNNDWGGIQAKTASATAAIGTQFQNLGTDLDKLGQAANLVTTDVGAAFDRLGTSITSHPLFIAGGMAARFVASTTGITVTAEQVGQAAGEAFAEGVKRGIVNLLPAGAIWRVIVDAAAPAAQEAIDKFSDEALRRAQARPIFDIEATRALVLAQGAWKNAGAAAMDDVAAGAQANLGKVASVMAQVQAMIKATLESSTDEADIRRALELSAAYETINRALGKLSPEIAAHVIVLRNMGAEQAAADFAAAHLAAALASEADGHTRATTQAREHVTALKAVATQAQETAAALQAVTASMGGATGKERLFDLVPGQAPLRTGSNVSVDPYIASLGQAAQQGAQAVQQHTAAVAANTIAVVPNTDAHSKATRAVDTFAAALGKAEQGTDNLTAITKGLRAEFLQGTLDLQGMMLALAAGVVGAADVRRFTNAQAKADYQDAIRKPGVMYDGPLTMPGLEPTYEQDVRENQAWLNAGQATLSYQMAAFQAAGGKGGLLYGQAFGAAAVPAFQQATAQIDGILSASGEKMDSYYSGDDLRRDLEIRTNVAKQLQTYTESTLAALNSYSGAYQQALPPATQLAAATSSIATAALQATSLLQSFAANPLINNGVPGPGMPGSGGERGVNTPLNQQFTEVFAQLQEADRQLALYGMFQGGTTNPYYALLEAIRQALGMGRTERIPAFASGGYMDHDGLAYLHQGEVVVPAPQASRGATTVVQHFTVSYAPTVGATSRSELTAVARLLTEDITREIRKRGTQF